MSEASSETVQIQEPKKDLVNELFQEALKRGNATLIPPKKYLVPKEYDLSHVPEADKNLVEEAIHHYQDYLKMPIITDNFKDHINERRQWRKESYQIALQESDRKTALEVENLLKRNKLRVNAIFSLVGWGDMVSNYFPKEPSQRLQKLIEEKVVKGDKTVDPWDSLPTPEKIKIVGEISEVTAEILRSLGK